MGFLGIAHEVTRRTILLYLFSLFSSLFRLANFFCSIFKFTDSFLF